MATTYLYRGSGESAANRKTWTWSAWIKRSKLSSQMMIVACSADSSNRAYLYFTNGDTIGFTEDGGTIDIYTTRKFRDTNSWYHIILACDTTQGTASNRMKLYVNGEQVALDNGSQPSQDYLLHFNRGGSYIPYIGTRAGQNPHYFDGCMSHIAHVNGTQELPTIFGETDSTTGEWKIKTSITPSNGWGTNGYHILKDGNSGTDQSGQSNNWTVGAGTLTKTEDCPSNVFAVNNPLASSGITISFGNTSAYKAGSGWNNVSSTLGASTGKYYAECKVNGVGSNGVGIGFVNLDKSNLQNSSIQGGEDNFSAGIYSNSGAIFYSSGTAWKTVGALSNGDIVQLAMDLDNGFLYWGKNGTWFDSANPESGSTGTGGLAISNLTSGGTYAFNTSVRNGGDVRWNYGNGFFEVTAVSSAGTNASGNGIFEYDVPANFTALSTKGLNL